MRRSEAAEAAEAERIISSTSPNTGLCNIPPALSLALHPPREPATATQSRQCRMKLHLPGFGPPLADSYLAGRVVDLPRPSPGAHGETTQHLPTSTFWRMGKIVGVIRGEPGAVAPDALTVTNLRRRCPCLSLQRPYEEHDLPTVAPTYRVTEPYS